MNAKSHITPSVLKLNNIIKQHKSFHKSKTITKNNTAAFERSKNTGETFKSDESKFLTKEPHIQKRQTLKAISIHLNKKVINLKS